MGAENVVTFEELMKGRKARKEPKREAETKPLNDEATVEAYWKEREAGKTRPKYVELFKKRYDGTAYSLLEALTYMNVYMADKDADVCLESSGIPFNETSFGYAEFYEWFAGEFLTNEQTADLVAYNFNGELPPILKFGEATYNDLVTYRDAAEYDELDPKLGIRKDGDRIIRYVMDATTIMSIMTFIDDGDVLFAADQVALYKDMPNDVREHMERIVKTNLLQLADDGGQALFIYYEDDELHVNGFGSVGDGFRPLSVNELKKAIPKFSELAKTQENYEELMQAFELGILEVPKKF